MDKIHLYDKIIAPLVTEKSTNLSEQNKIVFKVPSDANKKNLKSNIEKIFKVNITKINIINKKNRMKITRGKKIKISGFNVTTVGNYKVWRTVTPKDIPLNYRLEF